MTRVKNSIVSKKRHKKVLRLAKGYRGRSNNCFRIAVQKVEKGLTYSYRDRKKRKSYFRSIWIQRINAAVRDHGIVYSRFINGLKNLKICLNRKSISEIAVKYPKIFAKLVLKVKKNFGIYGINKT